MIKSLIRNFNRIQNAFSKAANRYDELATLQQAVGLRFLNQLIGENPRTVLDIGMGTGWFTGNLARQFPQAEIAGLDFAPGMVACAKKREGPFKIVQAEAEHLPFADGYFDLAVSNLSYQWVENLGSAFYEARRVLKNNGAFYFSAFGQNSLGELSASIKTSENSRAKEFSLVPSKEDYLNALLEAGFQNLHVTTENFKVTFNDTLALIRWLKDIGANASATKTFWGKERLARVDEFYRENFSQDGKIYATFEVVWGKGEKVVSRKS